MFLSKVRLKWVLLKMIKCGLTGAIGAGKTTIVNYLKQFGAIIFDSDLCVKELYHEDNELKLEINKVFPGVLIENKIDRKKLSKYLLDQGDQMFRNLERLVHPKIDQKREEFIRKYSATPVLFFDIPLLFETRSETNFHYILVVTTEEKIRKKRVLKREGMTEEKYKLMNQRQIKDELKREKADYLIETGISYKSSEIQAKAVYENILSKSG